MVLLLYWIDSRFYLRGKIFFSRTPRK
jgi:hypothetical protein